MANKTWLNDVFSSIYHEQEIKKIASESKDIYEMRMLNHSDIKMMEARAYFNEPVYYLKYLERLKERNYEYRSID